MQLERQFGIHMSLGSVHRYMRIFYLQSKRHRKYIPKRTKTQNQPYIVQNVLQQNFRVSPGNPPKWLTDITYLPCKDGLLYLSCIKDLSNNSIVAYHLSNKNDLSLVIQTLKKATDQMTQGIILHSDQGSQYCSPVYQHFLQQRGMIASMSRKATPYDNAPMESFFSILKNEELKLHKSITTHQMHTIIQHFIHYYNYLRPQWGLKKLTPVEYKDQFL